MNSEFQFKSNQKNIGFILLVLYLFLEYGRPQGLLPILAALRPGLILIGLLGIYLLMSGNIRFDTIQSKCMLGFFLLTAIHVPLAVNNYFAYEGARGFLMYLIVFLAISNFVNSVERLYRFVNLWILINLFSAVFGIMHGGRDPYSGFMGDENDFALVMNMAIPFAYFMMFGADTPFKKLLYGTAVSVFVMACVASFSRGGFVGLISVLLYCWYRTPRKVVASLAAIVIMGVLVLTAPPAYWDEVRSIKSENIESGTGEQRWYFFKVGLRMFLDHPIIGVGSGNYPILANSYQTQEELEVRKSLWFRSAHSIYTTLIAEMGSIGIALFLIILYYTYKSSKQAIVITQNNPLHGPVQQVNYVLMSINGALIGYLISGAFLSVLGYPHFWLMVALGTASTKLFKKPQEASMANKIALDQTVTVIR